jgi:hypothetical protein
MCHHRDPLRGSHLRGIDPDAHLTDHAAASACAVVREKEPVPRRPLREIRSGPVEAATGCDRFCLKGAELGVMTKRPSRSERRRFDRVLADASSESGQLALLIAAARASNAVWETAAERVLLGEYRRSFGAGSIRALVADRSESKAEAACGIVSVSRSGGRVSGAYAETTVRRVQNWWRRRSRRGRPSGS